ncbi:MAG: hypothetical protein WCT49_04570 [Candidatus Paceibacterota bacterium]|jgi:hypothetical protein|nr:hypothetical protein [Candidatus Paceibacterota bacterium]
MEKEIAFKSSIIAKENLPFPIVLYPGHYGAFFAFKKDEKSNAYFCSCAYEAIENYIKIRKLTPIPKNINKHRMYVLDSLNFPLPIVEALMSRSVETDKVLSVLNFSEKLCHECNLQTPSYRYCHEMYGGAFKQNYGWYINKQSFEWGFDRYKNKMVVLGACSDELLSLIENPDFNEMLKRVDLLTKEIELFFQAEQANQSPILVMERLGLFEKISKYKRKINNVIENEVRMKFGHKKVGEAWTSETILYYIIKKLYPQYTIYRHYRPAFLGGLELDIYLKEIRVGIEYQGIQHYKPIKHWGGEESFERLKERDKKKKQICKKENIPLIYFEYGEGLNDAYVKQKLDIYV